MAIRFLKDRSIPDNGTHQKVRKAARKAMVCKYGQTVPNSKDSGEMIWLMGTAALFSLTATFSREIGSMIKLMARVTTSTLKELLIRGIGTKTNKRGKAGRSGLTARSSKVNTYVARSMVTASFNGRMEPNTTASGKIIKCMAKENFDGQTAVSIKESTKMIRNMDKVSILGRTAGCTRACF